MAANVRSAMPASWPDFFPPSEFAPDDRRALLVADLVNFFLTGGGPGGADAHDGRTRGVGEGRGQAFVEALQPVGPGSYSLQVDFGSLEAASGLADLPAALEGSPVEALGCIAVAAHQAAFAHRRGRLLHARSTSGTSSEPPQPLPPGRIAVRLVNHAASQTHIRQLKSSSIGKLVTLRGTVVRMTPVRPLVTHMAFVCAKCSCRTELGFTDGLYTVPTKCAGDGCRSRTFAPHRSSARCIDSQKIRLQELLGADKAAEGQVPRSVEVELSGDLVHSCVVGDVVAVVGVVKVMATGDDLGKFAATGSAGGGGGPGGGGGGRGGGGGGRGSGGGGGSSLFLLYLDGVSVSGTRQQLPGSELRAPALGDATGGGPLGPYGSSDPSALPSFISKDLAFVVKFCESYGGDQLRQLVHALCPSIYGNELVKAGLVLSLLGGVRKHCGQGEQNGGEGSDGGGQTTAGAPQAAPAGHGSGSGSGRVPVRGDIHVLLVGDPGLGKSQLLQAAVAAAPRGIYVCGSTSTSAGLTVSVVRDGVTGESVLEAGAVVLADRGVCAVDEFDRMASEHQALLEVMEQQEVSVAKAGLVANLPARASILAAANPAGGTYNRAKSLAENIKLSPAMLSRFDLIFVLLDRPDEALDGALSEHVMALHSGLADRAHAARQRLIEYGTSAAAAPRLLTAGPSGGASQATQGGHTQAAARPPLSQRLKLASADDNAQLPVPLLRKYVSYARTYCHPRLSEEAKQVLQAFYLQIRSQAAPGSKNPVTARQLESLVRLAEARARAELREVVSRGDAEDVVELVREALYDRFGGDLGAGCTDYRGQAGGRAGSRGAEASRFMAALRRQGEREGRCVFASAELYSLANELSLAVRDVGAFVEQLNESGQLLKRGPGQYKLEGVVLPAASTQNNGSACF